MGQPPNNPKAAQSPPPQDSIEMAKLDVELDPLWHDLDWFVRVSPSVLTMDNHAVHRD